MKTWHYESGFVASVLAGVVFATGGSTLEWIGAAAVLATFGHASISFRMSEQIEHHEKTTGVRVVSCYKWSGYYFLLKEALWLTYFLMLGAWSALVGVFVFLLYPVWRKQYRKRKPYQPEQITQEETHGKDS